MRAWSRLVRLAARLVAVIIALVLLAAAVYEHVGAWRDSQVLKQVGRSVDIGGRTLNIHCTGEGSPTVVFVSGLYGGLATSGRQPNVASLHSPARAGMTALTSVGVMSILVHPWILMSKLVQPICRARRQTLNAGVGSAT